MFYALVGHRALKSRKWGARKSDGLRVLLATTSPSMPERSRRPEFRYLLCLAQLLGLRDGLETSRLPGCAQPFGSNVVAGQTCAFTPHLVDAGRVLVSIFLSDSGTGHLR
jgi:hypothetical protein